MRWADQEESVNVEDRRGLGGSGLRLGGGGLVVVLLIALVTGQNPLRLLNAVSGGSSSSAPYHPSAHEEEERKFTAVTLRDTEVVWHDIFKSMGREYTDPKLVIFTQEISSGCGQADAGMGPFYCGEDERVYIDLSFYDLMKQRFGATGDFAQAYVIAHEVGHHVQKLLGILDKVHGAQARAGRSANDLSVRLELQADFFAGVWAHHAQKMAELTEQDLRDALKTANAIGDDALQRQAQGYVVPDTFTHGTSEQRARWFMKGWQTGDIRQGDTFSARSL